MRQMVIRELDLGESKVLQIDTVVIMLRETSIFLFVCTGSRQYVQVDEGEGLAIKNALLDAHVNVTNTLGALNPAAAAVAKNTMQNKKKKVGNKKTESNQEKLCLPSVQSREEMKAASNNFLAKRFPKLVVNRRDSGAGKTGRRESVIGNNNNGGAAAGEDDLNAAGTTAIKAA